MSDETARMPHGVSGSILPRLGLCLFLFVAYGALDGSFGITSLISTAVLAPVFILFSSRMAAARPDRVVFRIAWLLQIPRVAWSLVAESIRVGRCLLSTIFGRNVHGALTILPFSPQGANADQIRTHRALAEIAGSASPNGIVLFITDDNPRPTMTVHQLRSAPLRSDWPV